MIPAIATIITVYAVARLAQITVTDVFAHRELPNAIRIALYIGFGIAAAVILSEWQAIQDAGSSIDDLGL